MGLSEYLEMVADYWSLGQEVCDRCDMCIEAGYCAMLHDSTVPGGNCLGLLAIGVRQSDEVPNDSGKPTTEAAKPL